MTKSQHEVLIKFNQLSQQRESCDIKEKRIKCFRRITLIAFIISVLLIVVYELAVHTMFLKSISISRIYEMIPGKEYTFLIIGLISFVLFLIAVFKSLDAEIQAEHARKSEGKMAQKAFTMMLIKTK